MTERGPDLSARMHRRQGCHGHVEDAGDFRRTGFAGDRVADRHLLYTEIGAHEGRKGGHRAALRAAEDRAERGGLPVAGPLIDVSRSHTPWLGRAVNGARSEARHGQTT